MSIGGRRWVAEARKTERPFSSLSSRSVYLWRRLAGGGIEEGSPPAIGHRPRAGDEALDAQPIGRGGGSPSRADDGVAEQPGCDLTLAGACHHGIMGAQRRDPARGAHFSRKELGGPAPRTGECDETLQGQTGRNRVGETTDPLCELDRPLAQCALDDVKPDRTEVMADPPMLALSIDLHHSPALQNGYVERFTAANRVRNCAKD